MDDILKNISDEDFYKLLKKKAKENDKVFQYCVGTCYLHGYNTGKNYDEALKWFKLSAEQGYAPAQNDLGDMYEEGLGVAENGGDAFKWYKLAAEQGFAPAQYNLACYYQFGEGVARDYKKALELIELSANQGCWYAFLDLGYIYWQGGGTDVNLPEAKNYFEQALAKADDEALYWDKATESDKKAMQDKLDEINEELEKIKEKEEKASKNERTDVFICYAHKDKFYCGEVRKWLKLLKTVNNINYWDDSKIKSGDEWDKAIKAALSKAKVAVLLVSIDFLTSDYVQEKELPKILETADKGGTTILWIPVGDCPYEDFELSKYQAVSDPESPLNGMTVDKRDKVFKKLHKEIKRIYDDDLKK